jgi:hypothetical protein
MLKKYSLFILGFLALALWMGPSVSSQESIYRVADFSEASLGKEPPKGWKLENKTGTPDFSLLKEGKNIILRFFSENSSFGLKKEFELDIQEYPYLNWSWKVTQLPPEGDFRTAKTDDQAAQVYVLFPHFPAAVNTEVVGYLWDTTAPAGSFGPSPAWSKSRVIVVKSGKQGLGKWYREKRNVYEDYQKLFGKHPPQVGGITLYINTQHTKGKAESFFDNIYFSKD